MKSVKSLQLTVSVNK